MEFPTSPGPWKFGYTDDLQTPIIIDANDDVVCVMHEGVTIKDGKLMAAATDLLEALQAIMEDMDSEFGTDYDYNKARAAIAKATGK